MTLPLSKLFWAVGPRQFAYGRPQSTAQALCGVLSRQLRSVGSRTQAREKYNPQRPKTFTDVVTGDDPHQRLHPLVRDTQPGIVSKIGQIEKSVVLSYDKNWKRKNWMVSVLWIGAAICGLGMCFMWFENALRWQSDPYAHFEYDNPGIFETVAKFFSFSVVPRVGVGFLLFLTPYFTYKTLSRQLGRRIFASRAIRKDINGKSHWWLQVETGMPFGRTNIFNVPIQAVKCPTFENLPESQLGSMTATRMGNTEMRFNTTGKLVFIINNLTMRDYYRMWALFNMDSLPPEKNPYLTPEQYRKIA